MNETQTTINHQNELDPSRNGFGITRLFFVVAICAVALAFAFPSSPIPGQFRPNQLFWRVVFGLSSFTVSVFSLLGASLVISKSIHDRSLPNEPGRLLFLFCASAVILINVAQLVFASLLDEQQLNNSLQLRGYSTGYLYVHALVHFFLSLICVFGFPRNRWWWRIGYLGLMASMLAKACIALLRMSSASQGNSAMVLYNVQAAAAVVFAVTFFWLLICGLIDLGTKTKRSRLHWLGVVCIFVYALLPTLTIMFALRFQTIRELTGIE